MIILPRMWPRQPQFNVPARATGLRHAWTVFGHGATGTNAIGIFDANRKADGRINVFGTGPAHYQVSHQPGNVLKFNVTGSGTVDSARVPVGDANGSGSPGGNVMTLVCLFNLADFSGNQAMYGANTNGVEYRINTSGKQEYIKSGVVLIGTSNTAVTAGAWTMAGVTYDGTNATFYFNGMADGTAASAQTFSHGQQYEIGGRNQSGPPAGAGDQFGQSGASSYMALFYVYDIVLTPSQMFSLWVNPWQEFMPSLKRVFDYSVSSGPVTSAQGIMFPSALSGIGSQGIFFGDRLQ